jgi:phenylacetate-CoA ligase
MGRADQTTKVRGLFIHPSQVATLLKRYPEISNARLVVSRENDLDRLVLRCESSSPGKEIEEKLKDTLRDICKLRGEIELVPPNSLPNDGKVIDDQRPIEE